MDTRKTTARIVGVLFIVATAASLLSTGLTQSILNAPDYLLQLSAHQSQVATGSLLQFVAAAGSAGIAISLYPILRNYNEGLALGSVAFRIVESVFYLVAALGLLSLLWLGQEYAGAGFPTTSIYQILGGWTLAVRNWANFVFGVLSFCLGAAMYYYLLYRSRLVPRWLSAWGLVGVASLLSMALLIVFGEKPSGMLLLLALPIASQEIVLAVWLIVKGFNAPTIASGSVKTNTNIHQPIAARI
jgi:Domain of unknown function (DUF4386)